MNKKGYSLAELLAVIVILSVVSLIVIPNIVTLITNGKRDTYNVQIDNIKTAMKNYVGQNTFSIPNSGSVYLTLYQLASTNLIDYKIKNPLTGKYLSLDTVLEIRNSPTGLEYIVNIDDNDISYTSNELDNLPNLELISDYGLSSNNLESIIKEASYNNTDLKSNVVITQIDETTYKYTLTESNKTVSILYNIIYNLGKEVYFNPVTGGTCTEYVEQNSVTGTKEGCMKWYIYNIDDNKVDMILDHNTTSLVSYNQINQTLKNDTINWVNFVKTNTRLITADEVAKITNANEILEWNSSKIYSELPTKGTSISYFYLDGASTSSSIWHTPYAQNDIISNYSWLYNNTYCVVNNVTNGCNIIDDTIYTINNNNLKIKGYWTSTTQDNKAWVIENGLLNIDTQDKEEYGIRPVIRVEKDLVL